MQLINHHWKDSSSNQIAWKNSVYISAAESNKYSFDCRSNKDKLIQIPDSLFQYLMGISFVEKALWEQKNSGKVENYNYSLLPCLKILILQATHSNLHLIHLYTPNLTILDLGYNNLRLHNANSFLLSISQLPYLQAFNLSTEGLECEQYLIPLVSRLKVFSAVSSKQLLTAFQLYTEKELTNLNSCRIELLSTRLPISSKPLLQYFVNHFKRMKQLNLEAADSDLNSDVLVEYDIGNNFPYLISLTLMKFELSEALVDCLLHLKYLREFSLLYNNIHAEYNEHNLLKFLSGFKNTLRFVRLTNLPQLTKQLCSSLAKLTNLLHFSIELQHPQPASIPHLYNIFHKHKTLIGIHIKFRGGYHCLEGEQLIYETEEMNGWMNNYFSEIESVAGIRQIVTWIMKRINQENIDAEYKGKALSALIDIGCNNREDKLLFSDYHSAYWQYKQLQTWNKYIKSNIISDEKQPEQELEAELSEGNEIAERPLVRYGGGMRTEMKEQISNNTILTEWESPTSSSSALTWLKSRIQKVFLNK